MNVPGRTADDAIPSILMPAASGPITLSSRREANDVLLVSFQGEATQLDWTALLPRLRYRVNSGQNRVVVDLTERHIFGFRSPGIGFEKLVSLSTMAREAGGGLVLCGVDQNARDYISLLGLSHSLLIEPDIEHAVALVRSDERLRARHESGWARLEASESDRGQLLKEDDDFGIGEYVDPSGIEGITLSAAQRADIRKTFVQMDGLLDTLPTEWIRRLAGSKYFGSYRDVFRCLDLYSAAHAHGPAEESATYPIEADMVVKFMQTINAFDVLLDHLPSAAKVEFRGGPLFHGWERVRRLFAVERA